MPFRSSKGSGFRDISTLKQFLKDHSSLHSLHVPSVRSRKEKVQNNFLSSGIYSFQLFGSWNNDILWMFNSSSTEYSITLHLCECWYRLGALSIELSVQNWAGNRMRRREKGCNGYLFPKMTVRMMESEEGSESPPSLLPQNKTSRRMCLSSVIRQWVIERPVKGLIWYQNSGVGCLFGSDFLDV